MVKSDQNSTQNFQNCTRLNWIKIQHKIFKILHMVKLDLKQSIFQLDVNTLYFPNFNKCINQNHVSHSLLSFVVFDSLYFSAFSSAIFIGVLMAFSSFDSKKYLYNGNNIVDFVHFNNFIFVILYSLDTRYITILPVFHLL